MLEGPCRHARRGMLVNGILTWLSSPYLSWWGLKYSEWNVIIKLEFVISILSITVLLSWLWPWCSPIWPSPLLLIDFFNSPSQLFLNHWTIHRDSKWPVWCQGESHCSCNHENLIWEFIRAGKRCKLMAVHVRSWNVGNCPFRAYEHAYNLLECTFLPLFYQSDDVSRRNRHWWVTWCRFTGMVYSRVQTNFRK